MSLTVADAFLRSWPFSPGLIAALGLAAAIYGRGWWLLHQRDPARWHGGRLAAYLGGLLTLFLALGSPVEPFGPLLLQAHMIQHMLLMMVAPPLVWLGAPMFPMLRGIPRPVRDVWVAPVLRSRGVRRGFARLTHPAPALVLYVGATWVWHIPGLYEAALRAPGLHRLQHLCFLGSSLLFWYPVVRPYPLRPRWSLWLLVPYLLIADISNTVLSALLTFSDQVIYPHYTQIPRLGGITALDDQATAGVIMWVPGSVGFLIPLGWIGVRLLFGDRKPGRTTMARPVSRARSTFPVLPIWGSPMPPRRRSGFDLLRVPVLGRFLGWRYARPAIQTVTTILAGVVIIDGLLGPRVSAMNLAGILPWIHWRGFVVLGLLTVGNVSCLACPFLVPRDLARRWRPARRYWPRQLRSKWLGVALVAGFFWSYEAFALWDSPRVTAGIVVGYFVVAFAVDSVFRGASFCKYVCPIGQFNFVQSLMAPLEVKVSDSAVCESCRTKDCIRGTPDGQRGCELDLFLPRKKGNLDCTFCLDCVHACPHNNIGIRPVQPGHDLADDEVNRAGIGRLRDRPDLAALILVLVFGSFANAGGMVAPVQAAEERLATTLWLSDPWPIVSLYYLVALVVAPGLTFALAALGDRRRGADGAWWKSATRFSFALVPLGFAMWLAHYSFHLITSCQAVVPATQRFVASLGWEVLGPPAWAAACCRPVAAWLPRLEIIVLDLGLLLSLHTGWRIANRHQPVAWKSFGAWALLIVILFAAGVWIVLQPMQMRGTLPRLGG